MKRVKKIIIYFVLILVSGIVILANWLWPLFRFFDDNNITRFIWLALFFILLDIVFELISKIFEEFRVVMEDMDLGHRLKKISDTFQVAIKVSLPNNVTADYVVIGSSGIWLIEAIAGNGKIGFDGDEITQNGEIIKGLISKVSEKAFALAGILRKKFERDYTVTSIVVFLNPKTDTSAVPKQVRGVYISSGSDAVSIIENTDVQLIDKNTSMEIHKFLKNGK